MALNLKKKPEPITAPAPVSDIPAEDQIDFRLVPIDKVEKNDYNPNSMEAELFEEITRQVKEEGMNQPLLCRVNPAKEGYYLIIDGEHRYEAAVIAGKKFIPIIVVPFDETRAKVRTLSMNGLRGQNIPIKLARLLVDLHKEFSSAEIARMTGVKEDQQVSVLKLLEVPDFKPSDGVKLTPTTQAAPLPVMLLLMPEEHLAYTTAMKRAMKISGDDVVALIGHEVESYDKAMKGSMGIAGAKLRNVALALICETFNSLSKEQQTQIAAAAHKKIYDKLANDAEAKEEAKEKSGKKVKLAKAV
jgi:ParB/RepB/Spo0J family partition protein